MSRNGRGPVVVVGGGPAGAHAALTLARSGVPATLLERGTPDHGTVCGEFLGPEAIAVLDELGFPWAEAEAHVYRGLRLCLGERVIEAPLPHPGRGVRRSYLDNWLRTQAAAAGVRVVHEAHVRGAAWAARRGRFEVETAATGSFETPALFLATGKQSLPGRERRQARDGGRLVGLKVDLTNLPRALVKRYTERLELFFLEDGYGGVAQVASDRLTVCLVVDKARALIWGGQTDRLLAALADEIPALAGLGAATPTSARPRAVAPLPYGYVATAPAPDTPPVFALGDQFAVLPSLTGTGIGLALATGALAAQAFVAGAPPELAVAQYVAAARAAGLRVQRRGLPLHLGLQRPFVARAVMAALSGWPRLVSWAAAFTRLGPVGGLHAPA